MVYVSAKTFMVENFGWYIGDNQTAKFFLCIAKDFVAPVPLVQLLLYIK